jgi:hypothetical protein
MEIITTKIEMERRMFAKMGELFPEMSDYDKRKTSIALSEMTSIEIHNTNKDMSKTLMDLVIEYEVNRKKFRDAIEMIQANTKILMYNLKKEALITYKTNPKTKKTELVGRSQVLTDMVKFINKMDEMVLDFYENVYKIKDEKGIQTDLFT